MCTLAGECCHPYVTHQQKLMYRLVIPLGIPGIHIQVEHWRIRIPIISCSDLSINAARRSANLVELVLNPHYIYNSWLHVSYYIYIYINIHISICIYLLFIYLSTYTCICPSMSICFHHKAYRKPWISTGLAQAPLQGLSSSLALVGAQPRPQPGNLSGLSKKSNVICTCDIDILWYFTFVHIVWCVTCMKILPANSEGCWIFIFVVFLAFFVIWFCICLSFLFCAVILLSFGFAFFCHFFVIWFCIFLSLFFSFSCRFLVRRGWLDPEPTWKIQKFTFYQHLSHLFVIFS